MSTIENLFGKRSTGSELRKHQGLELVRSRLNARQGVWQRNITVDPNGNPVEFEQVQLDAFQLKIEVKQAGGVTGYGLATAYGVNTDTEQIVEIPERRGLYYDYTSSDLDN